MLRSHDGAGRWCREPPRHLVLQGGHGLIECLAKARAEELLLRDEDETQRRNRELHLRL